MENESNDKIKILYVDDEQHNLNAFRAHFRVKRDYEIFTCRSGEEGLMILKNQNVNIVVSDQKMPSMTGVEFLDKISDWCFEPIKVAVTAHRDKCAIELAFQEGRIFGYLDKPWKLDALEQLIESAYKEFLRRNMQ